MIRIPLSSDDVARVRIASTPDYGLELMSGGAVLSERNPLALPRLARWRAEIWRRQTPDTLLAVSGLYTARSLPGMLGHPERVPAAEIAGYLEHISGERGLSRFHRALIEGEQAAHGRLNAAVSHFRATAIDPYRRRIASAVARSAARASAHAANEGIGAALSTIHPKIRWTGTTLLLDTRSEHHCELAGRTLIIRPLTLALGIVLIDDADPATVTVGYPAAFALSAADHLQRTPTAALTALLGTSRAATLTTVAWSPAITTGELADSLGLSPATASRHATVLRGAGLIDTVRDGQAVRHQLTRLGRDLLADSDHA
ncbi:MAG: helix-turn-helix transcriptional regulator [Catenulispora sp.]|nr:helix-turn-helix transcriptional regulator [Catenulispora sp.]